MTVHTPTSKKDAETKNVAVIETCKGCKKVPELCLCSVVKPMPTKLHVLILQHPQEPDKALGTAWLAHSALSNSTLKVGLSWPNLTKALGRPAENAKWGVLFLGGKLGSKPHPEDRINIQTKNGTTFEPDFSGLEGIVILDGTWAQAKTMWWRNAWLLKLKRVTLNPLHRSMYGRIRKEPRKECLSTIEAIAETLEALFENPEIPNGLREYFKELINRLQKQGKPQRD